jgi:hypothetical protein
LFLKDLLCLHSLFDRHLDFHTSLHIPGIGEDFEPGEFIDTLRDGHVNSVTVFPSGAARFSTLLRT